MNEKAYLEFLKDMSRYNFLNAMSLRFILLFLIVLLVKILFAYYKYNIKMKNFYASRKIAINLSGIEEIERVKTFSKVYAADKIDLVVDELGGNGLLDIVKSLFAK